jgi:putative oxidoreductase
MGCAGNFVNDLHSLEWVGILMARSAAGLLFFLSGRAKLFVPERREQMHQTLIKAHVPFPNFNAVFVSAVEFVCGLLLVLGAVTPLASVLLASVMVVPSRRQQFLTSKQPRQRSGLRHFCICPRCFIW